MLAKFIEAKELLKVEFTTKIPKVSIVSWV